MTWNLFTHCAYKDSRTENSTSSRKRVLTFVLCAIPVSRMLFEKRHGAATTQFLMSVLAFELEVTSYMTLNHVGGDALVVPDELVGQSGTGKIGLRLRKDR